MTWKHLTVSERKAVQDIFNLIMNIWAFINHFSFTEYILKQVFETFGDKTFLIPENQTCVALKLIYINIGGVSSKIHA